MTHDVPQDQQPQPHHHHQQEHQQDFKQKLEALYSQSKSWFDRQKQDLENLEAHQHDINQVNLESIANVKANLQLTRSDVTFLRTNIRTQDKHIDDLRVLIDKNKQLSTIQIETVAHLKLERASLLAYQKTLHRRAEKLEADLAAMTLRIEALGRQLSRLKKEVREHKEAPRHNTATTVAEEGRRAQEIQRILSTIHGYEAVHAYALERIPPPPTSDLSHEPSQVLDQYRENSSSSSSLPPPSPRAQPTIYFIADTLRGKPSLTPTSTPSSSSTLLLPVTFNPANPFFLTTSPPPQPLSIAATTSTTAAGNTPKETVTPASPFQLPHAQQPSPPLQPQLSPEKLLRLQQGHQKIEDYKALMTQQTEQSQYLSQQFPLQDQDQDQRPRIPRNPIATSPQFSHALVSFALSLSVSFLAYITIRIYSFFLQPNQQYQQPEDLATVCETTYNTNSMSWLLLQEGKAFIPT